MLLFKLCFSSFLRFSGFLRIRFCNILALESAEVSGNRKLGMNDPKILFLNFTTSFRRAQLDS